MKVYHYWISLLMNDVQSVINSGNLHVHVTDFSNSTSLLMSL